MIPDNMTVFSILNIPKKLSKEEVKNYQNIKLKKILKDFMMKLKEEKL